MYGNPQGYENYMGRWSAALAPSFLRFACACEPSAILDIGCGTGSLMRAAAKSFPASQLVGLDPVPSYVVHARSTMGRDRADFVAGVVEKLPFPDGAFECCLSLLVLQDIRDQIQGLSEMRRVTRPGGVVAACQWDFDRGMPLTAALEEALAGTVAKTPDGLSSGSGRAFVSEAQLGQTWAAAGLERVETARLAVTLRYANFDDLWQPLLSGSTPRLAVVASLPPKAKEAVRRRLKKSILGGRLDGSFLLDAEAFAVRGRVACDALPR